MIAKVIQVIVTETPEGKGIQSDPVRMVVRHWSLTGELLAEVDPCKVAMLCVPVQNAGPNEEFKSLT